MSNLPTDPLRQEHLELLPRLHDLQQAAVEAEALFAAIGEAAHPHHQHS